MTKPFNLAAAAVLVASAVPAVAQTTTTTKTTKTPEAVTTTTKTTSRTAGKTSAHKRATVVRESASERQIREVRAELQAQIDELKQQLAARDTQLNTAQAAVQTATDQASAANAQSQAILAQVQDNQTKIDTVQSTVSDLVVQSQGLTQTIINNNNEIKAAVESPTTIHYKGVTITPVAFLALESVYRTRSVNSDVNTPFNTIPYGAASEAHVSEFQFSGRQSRIGALFQGDTGKFKLAGYVEADFLSAGTTSNNNQSNSFTLRQRQAWGQLATASGFTVTGGQMWSLATETGKSTDARTEKLPNTIDAQYMVGFNWERQPGIRVQQKLGNTNLFGKGSALTLAASLEEAQITSYNATNAPANFFFNGLGQNGGLYNAFNGTPNNNLAPDVLFKAALDLPKAHFEVGGVARFFRERYYPAIVTAGTGAANAVPGAVAKNYTSTAGGGFVHARVSPSKYVDVAFSFMGGDGIGRYASAQLADATVRPNGTLAPVRGVNSLVSIETHPTPKLDVWGYGGGEYAQRTQYVTGVAASPYTGYGVRTNNVSGCTVEVPSTGVAGTAVSPSGGSVTPSSGTCSAVTRDIFEGTAGFTYRLVNSPKVGRLQYSMQYSYLTKNAWTGLQSGTVNTPSAVYFAPKATENMVFTGLRYYIP